MANGLLEVIALDARDARAAVDGGADRIELVSGMEFAGFCPALETVELVRAAVDVPVRVMLRLRDDFSIGGAQGAAEIAAAGRRLREAGADQFVLGWLDGAGAVDLAAIEKVREAWEGLPFTFHKAMDHVADRDAAYAAIRGLPGIDTVLTSGGPFPSGQGVSVLAAEAAREAALGADGLAILVGGGLKLADVPALRAAGLRDFHVGSSVRGGADWSGNVDAELVGRWRDAIDG
ncbi:MAG TPA: copper homeostasis protein CutC [Actinospica sp.]|jgi:copper homeostasis protein|nr:copper homeostasis protein CutC [Actinospica sp.]